MSELRELNDKKAQKRRASEAKALYGGTPSLHGILIKIALLAILDAAGVFAAMQLISFKQWGYFAVEILVLLVVNFAYLRRGGLPGKYLAPGVLFLIAFQVSVVLYSAYIAFTNYGALHNGGIQDSIVQIKLDSAVNDTSAPFMPVTVVKDSKGQLEFLASDFTNEKKPVYYIGGDTTQGAVYPWHQITDVQNVKTETVVSQTTLNNIQQAVGYTGVTALTLDQVSLPENQALISSLKVAIDGKSIDSKAGFMAADPSATGVQRTYFDSLYNAKTNTFTRVSDGTVFTANNSTGFFESKSGERISQTGWRVEIGWANFTKIFGDQNLRGPLANILAWTVMFAFGSVASTFVLGLALAFLFNDERIRFRKVYRSIMILPYAFPAFLSAYVWKGMFNTEGFINRSILQIHDTHALIPWLTQVGPARWAVLLCNLWLGFPYMFLICTGALQAIPAELTESATIDGATAWQQFRLIKLPLLLVTLAPLLISSFAFNFNNFTIIYLLTGGGPAGDPSLAVQAGGTDILISFVYKIAFSTGVGADYGLASAFSILIFLFIGSFSMISFRRTRFLEDLN
jgi:arabinogalactan oligomer/maltooligosaccharide transport system permease protein